MSSSQTPAIPARGHIITFYSYKGGTGRSMALANVGCLLAKDTETAPRGVLLIDWDLEAPGLGRYFDGHLESGSRKKRGLIDFFEEALRSATTQTSGAGHGKLFASFGDYVTKTDIPGLCLMNAGLTDSTYGERVRTFNWEKFHELDSTFFPEFRQFLEQRYSYVLIDSRTGLTDTSGICTQQMPEKLVVVFVLNHQNIDGVVDVVERVAAYRRRAESPQPLSVFPLPSRVDADRSRLRDIWRSGGEIDGLRIEGYESRFRNLFMKLYGLEADECNIQTYFSTVQIPHDSDYAYGEKIAALGGPGDKLSIANKFAEFTSRLVKLKVPWDTLPEEEAEVAQQKAAASDAARLEAEQRLAQAAKQQSQMFRRVVATIGVAAAALIVWVVLIPFVLNSTEWGQRYQFQREAVALSQAANLDSKARTEWAIAQIRLGNAEEAAAALSRIAVPEQVDALLDASRQWLALENQASAVIDLNEANKLVAINGSSSYVNQLFEIVELRWLLKDADGVRSAFSLVNSYTPDDPGDRVRYLARAAQLAQTIESADRSAWEALSRLSTDTRVFGPEARGPLVIAWARLNTPRSVQIAEQMFANPWERGVALSAATAGWAIQKDEKAVARTLDSIEKLDSEIQKGGIQNSAQSAARIQRRPALGVSTELGIVMTKPRLTALADGIVGTAWTFAEKPDEGKRQLDRALEEMRMQPSGEPRSLLTAALVELFVLAELPHDLDKVTAEISDKKRREALLVAAAIGAARQDSRGPGGDALSVVSDGELKTKLFIELAAASVRTGSWTDARDYARQIADDSRRLEAYSRVLSSWKAKSDKRLETLDAETYKKERMDRFWNLLLELMASATPPAAAR